MNLSFIEEITPETAKPPGASKLATARPGQLSPATGDEDFSGATTLRMLRRRRSGDLSRGLLESLETGSPRDFELLNRAEPGLR